MKITFLGHAGFLIDGSASVLIDPFLTNNPVAVQSEGDLKADYVLVSHGHHDHMGDAVPIAKRCNSTAVGVAEIANYFSRHDANAHAMHIGGAHDFGPLKIKLTPAWHGSSLPRDDGTMEYLGTPCGFIVEMDGKTIYHAGDTGLFGDMRLIGKHSGIDLALIPIGDNFTMGPEDALEAIKLIKPKRVVPMHYNTWPLIEQDVEKFKQEVETNTDTKVTILKPGESAEV
ncbi:MAG TPA: metal-dependent hydrolase [Clostridia bacterium]|nr:metal-dependent hydrolase [Clostridia bacterium]